jgi:transcriptional regulator with XRE-family HTH domain
MTYKLAENPEGRSLARKRRQLGLTQHDLARAVGISVNRLVFAETGRVTLEPETLHKIRHVLRKHARRMLRKLEELEA